MMLRILAAGTGMALIALGVNRTAPFATDTPQPQPAIPVAIPVSSIPRPTVVSVTVTTPSSVSVSTTRISKPTTTTTTTRPSPPTTIPVETTLVPAVTIPASTTTVPLTDISVMRRQYTMYERNGDVLHLQMALGLASVDGIYGPITRTAHMNYLGGPKSAIYVFYPDLAHANRPIPVPQTLGELVARFFRSDDQAWALKVAFCESSALPHHTHSAEVSSALAAGWFQHLAKFWDDRSDRAGYGGWGIFNTEANTAVAAWLFYTSGPHHWNPSRTCWEAQ